MAEIKRTKKFMNIKDIQADVDEMYLIVAEYKPYTLIYRFTSFQPWVAAWCYDPESKSWANGNYFQDLKDAMKYIEDNMEKEDA